MTKKVESSALSEALLRTERLRIMGVLFIISAFAVTGAIRIYLFGSHMTHVGLYGALILAFYELSVLQAVQRSLKSGFAIPDWFWTINVIIELSMPAFGVAFLVSERIPPDYRALASSWVLLFFPFLLLSILRLKPYVCLVATATAVTGYFLAAVHQGWHIKSDLLANAVTHTAVPIFAMMICATGLVAAIVAREMRKHLEAALREAEAQRVIKQMEHDLSIARSIQQSLLPKVRPHIEGYEIAGWNRSADATGGDYFDWKQLQDGSVAVTLADITGHGIGPALLAAVCRAYARASFSNEDSLAQQIQRVNASFRDDISPGNFATFVAAVCHAKDEKIELLSAGHAPLFWYSHETRELRTFPAHDVPLGVLPKLTVQGAQVLSMQRGDIVLLITDGFLEWENAAGEPFGVHRLEHLIQTNCDLSPEQIIAELYAGVLAFADGTIQQDDLTAVVIKRTAGTAPDLISPLVNDQLGTTLIQP